MRRRSARTRVLRRRSARTRFGAHRVFEADGGGREGLVAQEGERFAGAEFALHAAVFPFDGEGAFVADVVEGAQDGIQVHLAAPGGDEIPTAAGVAEGEVAGEAGVAAVEVADAVFDVDVEDAIGEGVYELDGVDALGDEVAGVEVDAEGGVAVDGFEGGGEGMDIVGDFGGVDFEGEADAEAGWNSARMGRQRAAKSA